MTNLIDLTIEGALEGLDKKEFSAVELTKAHIDSMEKQKSLNAFITETPEIALEMAEESDKRRAAGNAGAIDGIPLAIKDIFCTEGVRTTAASKILENFIPQYSSTVTTKLFGDGAVMLGKANTDQFAMGTTTESSYFESAINPWRDRNRPDVPMTPGGSSGGSASSVASHMAMGATGTDTGGSIRQPAAMCGIAGIRPTYGRCSRWGIVAFASSFDQAGVFARNAKDCAVLLKSAAGHDPKDSTSAKIEVPDFRAAINGDVKGMKIGIPKEYRVDGMPEEIEKTWQKGAEMLKAAGAEIVDISLPHTKYGLAAYYVLTPSEASSNLARYDGVRYGLRVEGEDLKDMYENTRKEGFGDEVTRRIMIGTYALSAGYYDAYYIKAQKVRRLIANDFINAFKQVDAILTPPTPSAAFPVGEITDDPIANYIADVFTVSLNLAGLPGMSVPVALNENGLPLGLQIIGNYWDEETVLKLGGFLQDASGFDGLPEVKAKANV
jgi:aspartyl-tRNA(Asn)/glutamyl-tRNA(Gln) amidotransferase subunit A